MRQKNKLLVDSQYLFWNNNLYAFRVSLYSIKNIISRGERYPWFFLTTKLMLTAIIRLLVFAEDVNVLSVDYVYCSV